VTADAPVQVIGGHYCTQVPIGVTACDHLEESMFPIAALGTSYAITAPTVPAMIGGKPHTVRIVAVEADTALAYDPPRPAAPTHIAAAGAFVELAGVDAPLLVTADKKILVAQYMHGQGAPGGTGDPSLALAVPIAQFRADYLVHAPVNYAIGYADVVAPAGASVTVDGAPLDFFLPIGDTGYAFARATLVGSLDGNHRLAADVPFGVTVYGYGDYTSYWYPGGLDLAPIVVP
jgi:hypothetical protein